MKARTPNLFVEGRNGEHDYQLYLAQLMIAGDARRIVQVCRRIRAYAARGPGVEAGLFSYFFEHNALCDLRQYAAAWKQLLRRDRVTRGPSFDYRTHAWTSADSHDLRFHYGPLLYLMGRYSEAADLLEKSLAFECRGQVGAYEAMHTVANDDDEPSNHYRVTLLHCYRRLGRSLTEWSGWRRFVRNLHPKLLRMARIPREELLAKPELLVKFQTELQRELYERTEGSGGTWGMCDLLESPSRVKRRHAKTVRDIKQFQANIRDRKEKKERELSDLFGDYQVLPES